MQSTRTGSAEQQYLAPDGTITNVPGSNAQPKSRPRLNHATLRTVAANTQQPFEFSTHRARREASPQYQAQRAKEVAAKRVEQNERQRFGMNWLMNLLTK